MPNQHELDAELRGCLDACDRCVAVLDALSPEQFAGTCARGYPIGAHMRHVLDHFVCFLEGVGEGRVDYDARARDIDVERYPVRFRAVLAEVRASLEAFDAELLDRPVTILQIAALDAPSSTLPSTVRRELVFLSSHAIHHLALVAHLCEVQGIALPEETALAFSTAAYRQATAS